MVRIGFFYDFDLTLTEEYQQLPILRKFSKQLKKKYNVTSILDYFKMCNVAKDGGVGWMYQFLEDAPKIFDHLTNEKMEKIFAPKIKLSEGLMSWFQRVNEYASSLGIEVEHHVISSGASPLIKGSRIYPYLTSAVSGEFLEKDNKFFKSKKKIDKISFIVEPFRKVEILKRICKGGDLYKNLSIENYHINYRNVIVFGDGLSDKDWFKFIKQRGGFAIGVFEKGNRDVFEKSVASLGSRNPIESSVNFILPRDYREGSILQEKIFQILKDISESEKKCNMDWEIITKWQLGHIENKKVININEIKKHLTSCKYCQKKMKTEFIFE